MQKNRRTEYGRAVYAARISHEWTQPELARRAGMSHAGINRIENGNRRPDPATLRALAHCWHDRAESARILIEHLRDEITRAGMTRAGILMHVDGDGDRAHADHAMSRIREADPEAYAHLVELIEDLWRLISAAPIARNIAAESPAEYGPTPTEGKKTFPAAAPKQARKSRKPCKNKGGTQPDTPAK